jgi:Ca2+-transporting ATPase
MVFTAITFSEMAFALAVRSERDSLFRIGLFSNKSLLGAVTLTFFLQLTVIYTPFLQGIFRTKPLSAPDLLICLALSAVVFAAVEIEKVFLRRKPLPNFTPRIN